MSNVSIDPYVVSSSFKKLLLYEHKNIFCQRNIGVFILEATCLKIGDELSGPWANCLRGELSGYRFNILLVVLNYHLKGSKFLFASY